MYFNCKNINLKDKKLWHVHKYGFGIFGHSDLGSTKTLVWWKMDTAKNVKWMKERPNCIDFRVRTGKNWQNIEYRSQKSLYTYILLCSWYHARSSKIWRMHIRNHQKTRRDRKIWQTKRPLAVLIRLLITYYQF